MTCVKYPFYKSMQIQVQVHWNWEFPHPTSWEGAQSTTSLLHRNPQNIFILKKVSSSHLRNPIVALLGTPPMAPIHHFLDCCTILGSAQVDTKNIPNMHPPFEECLPWLVPHCCSSCLLQVQIVLFLCFKSKFSSFFSLNAPLNYRLPSVPRDAPKGCTHSSLI